jgi:hypothetical protein
MNNFLNLIDKYKFSILAVFVLYIGIFMYLQISSFEKSYYIEGWFSDKKIKHDEIMLEIQPENIEVQQEFTSSVKNLVRDQNDTREKSMDKWTEAKPAKESSKEFTRSSKEIEQSIKALEKQFFNETGGEEKRKKIIEEKNIKLSKNSESKKTSNTVVTTSGGDKAFGGNVMVNWSLQNRDPHQNDPYFVRNPGYTCGDKTTGLVTIRIKVDQSGRVVDAKYNPSASNLATPCMIEQALKYALISRFNYSNTSASLQDGTIRYTFVSQ